MTDFYTLLEYAERIGKDPGNWYNVFLIDKGSNDGLETDMVVLSGNGLVGHIIETAPNYSKVLSIIDDRNAVSSKVLRTSDLGVTKGDLTLMNEEPYKSNLPCFEEKEIQKFKYYENSIDSHQEDFFVVLEYDNEDQFINSLNRIKAFMPNYKTEINKFNDSYQDIINSNKMNSYEMKKVNNTYEIIGEYLVISYETNSKRIVISYWNFLSDEFISDHNPYMFEYFEYIL